MDIDSSETAGSRPQDQVVAAPGRRRHGDAVWLPAPQAVVYDLLTEQTMSCTAVELAALAGRHPNTVREHLAELVEAGLVERTRYRIGRGRPTWHYQVLEATRQAHTSPPPPRPGRRRCG